jgi:RND superfamily putative drug exporter
MARNAAWWIPGWLARLLPNLDIEGERLQREHEVPEQRASVHLLHR